MINIKFDDQHTHTHSGDAHETLGEISLILIHQSLESLSPGFDLTLAFLVVGLTD